MLRTVQDARVLELLEYLVRAPGSPSISFELRVIGLIAVADEIDVDAVIAYELEQGLLRQLVGQGNLCLTHQP